MKTRLQHMFLLVERDSGESVLPFGYETRAGAEAALARLQAFLDSVKEHIEEARGEEVDRLTASEHLEIVEADAVIITLDEPGRSKPELN